MVPSIQVIEAGESEIRGYLQLHSKFEANLIYMRLCVHACACVCAMGEKGGGEEEQKARFTITILDR